MMIMLIITHRKKMMASVKTTDCPWKVMLNMSNVVTSSLIDTVGPLGLVGLVDLHILGAV